MRSGLHREALIATGVVLFVFILIINFSVALLEEEDRIMSSNEVTCQRQAEKHTRKHPGSFLVMLLVMLWSDC